MSEEVGLDEIWSDDLLGREDDAFRLYAFIVNRIKERKAAGRSGSYVMNVDAEWGQGKSFFLDRFYQHVLALKHPAVFVNAWRDDFSDDPFTSVLSEFSTYIDEFAGKTEKSTGRLEQLFGVVKKNAGKIMWIGTKGIAGKIVERAIGDAKGELMDLISTNDQSSDSLATDLADGGSKAFSDAANHVIDEFADKRIDEFNSAKKSIVNFEKSFSEIIEMLAVDGKKLPFFIFVDELDRCRPTYAISMLERIKHLFDVDNVVFLIATDTDQLTESIKAVYGQGFNSRKYLSRFFNRPYVLPSPNRYKLIEAILHRYNFDSAKLFLPFGLSDVTEVLVEMSEHYSLDIRQLEHAIDILASIATTWTEPVKIDLLIIFPLIIGVLAKNSMETNVEKMAIFTRQNKTGHSLTLRTPSSNAVNVLTVATWASNYLNNTENTTLQGAMTALSNQLNNNNGQNPILIEIFRQIEAEHNARGRKSISLVAQYVEVIQSMRSFTQLDH